MYDISISLFVLYYVLQSMHKSVSQTLQLPVSKSIYYSFPPSLSPVVYLYCTSIGVERLCLNWGRNPGNPFRLFHATFSLLNKPEIRDRIAFWNSFHTKCILLSLSHKKLCVLGFQHWGEVMGARVTVEWVWIPGNPFTSFHATFRLWNQLEIRDRIAFWSSFHTKCILLSLSHKKWYVLGS